MLTENTTAVDGFSIDAKCGNAREKIPDRKGDVDYIICENNKGAEKEISLFLLFFDNAFLSR
ncbi:MAG TPA: hypothetical protein ENJ95_07155 [Bacteroidetes bacterium]|nr:hypothetical protein [Bacteroidota bacterium]